MQDFHKQYNENGFVIIPSLIPQKSIDKIFNQIDTLLTEALQNQDINLNQYPSVEDKFILLKNEYPDMKSHVYDLMKLLDSVQHVANYPRIIEIIQSITKTPLFVDNVLIRPDDFSNDRQRQFHQEGLGQISYDAVNFWAPLIDVNETTGSIQFIPKSHQQGYVDHQFYQKGNNCYHGIAEALIEQGSQTIAHMNKGDVLLFHPCLFHASAPMLKDIGMRWTLIARYSGFNNVPYLQDKNAPMRTEQK